MKETSLKVNESFEGETIEMRMERVVHNGDDADDGAPSIYTDRADGVLPEYDIRTDKFDLALDGMDAAHKTDLAKRKQGIADRTKEIKDLHDKEKGGGDGIAEPTEVQ